LTVSPLLAACFFHYTGHIYTSLFSLVRIIIVLNSIARVVQKKKHRKNR
jgi:hypothetical protein